MSSAATPYTAPRDHLYVLLVAAVLAYAPLARELPLWVSAIFWIGVGWCFAASRWRVVQPGRWARALATIVIIALVYREFGGLLGRDPGVALLIGLTGLKLLELRDRRDYVLTALLLYVVLLGAFLYAQSLALGLYGVVAAVVVTLALLQLGHITPMPMRTAWRWTAVLLLEAVPIMLVFYFLFPRLGGALWGVPVPDGAAQTGMSDTMRPGSVSRLAESNEPAFRATFEGTAPAFAALYWRGLVLWDTDGRSWRAGAFAGPIEETVQPRGEPVRYQITLEPHQQRWLYALDVPASIPPDARMARGMTVERQRPLLERHTYDMVSYPAYRTGALAETDRARALALPATTSARVRSLAAGWRAASGAADATVVAAALQHFRREPFVYTLEPPPLGNDPVDAFLFDTRRGFCEHYAAAFVTLMRAAGIPSRVVIGYQGGVHNPAGDYFIVRQADAHAWAEVWLRNDGWRRVDPTAAVAPERVELGMDAARRLQAQGVRRDTLTAEMLARMVALGWFDRAWLRTQLAWDYANLSWYRWVGNYDRERRDELLARWHLSNHALLAMLCGVAGLVLLYALYHARQRGARDPVADAYARFCRRLARIGLTRRADEGPLDFASRCGAARPDLRAAIANVTRHYVMLRYGPRPASAHRAALIRAVRGFRPRRAA